MDKMQMAHEYALEMLKETIPTGSLYGSEARSVAESIVKSAFALADMMQAEADKRNKAEAEQKRKEMRELLNADNTFLEKEGQHFDDVNWQPDWSQAPRFDVIAWDINEHGQARWIASDGGYYLAPSFGYTGNWKDSLRERPE